MSNAEFMAKRSGHSNGKGLKYPHVPTTFSTKPPSGPKHTTPTSKSKRFCLWDCAPPSKDWRAEGKVTRVKDQGQCGDCWAFASVASIESAWAIAGHPLVSLSEQQLLDCAPSHGGCDGSLAQAAFAYVWNHGSIDTEESYPYVGVKGVCHASQHTEGAHITGMHETIPLDPDSMVDYVGLKGPLTVLVDASVLQSYSGGVITGSCGWAVDHVVTIVGYGTTPQGLDYWIIKNSWGTGWGIDGYFYLQRGWNNECGVNAVGVAATAN